MAALSEDLGSVFSIYGSSQLLVPGDSVPLLASLGTIYTYRQNIIYIKNNIKT